MMKLVVLLVTVSALCESFGMASPCPVSLVDDPLNLSSRAAYDFRDCVIPVRAVGTDVEDVTVLLVNSTFNRLEFRGNFARNISIFFVDVDAPSRTVRFIAKEIERVLVSFVRSRMQTPDALVLFSDADLVARVSLRVAERSVLQAPQDMFLFRRLLQLGDVDAACQNSTFTLTGNSSLTAVLSTSSMIPGATVTVRFMQGSLLAEGVGLFHASDSADIAGITVHVVNSTVNLSHPLVSIGDSTMQPSALVSVYIVQESHVRAGSLLSVWNAKALGAVDVVVCNSSAILKYSTSREGSAGGGAVALWLRNTTAEAPVRLQIINSTTLRNVHGAQSAWSMEFASVMAVSAVHLAEDAHVSLIIRESSVWLSLPAGLAVVSVVQLTDVLTALSSSRAVTVQISHSDMNISATVGAAVLAVTELRELSLTFSVDDSEILLDTAEQKTFSAGVGSALAAVLNARVHNAVINVSRTTMTCQGVCRELIGARAVPLNDFLYNLVVFAFTGSWPRGLFKPNMVNLSAWFKDVQLTRRGEPPPAAVAVPMFSFAYATNTTIVVEGPASIELGLFDGLLGSSARPLAAAANNVLELPSCGELTFRGEDGRVDAGLAGHVLPRGGLYPEARVRSWRGNGSAGGGGGSCLPTGTASPHVTTSTTGSCSRTGSQSESQELPVAVAELPVLLKRQVAAGFVAGLGLLSGTSSGAALQVLHAQRAVSACGSDGDGEAEQALDVASSPLQLSVGPGGGRFNRGAVVGNAAILAACCAATALVVLLKGCSAADVMMPGLLFLPWGYLGVPTLTAAVSCFAEASSSSPEDGITGETSTGANIAIGLLGVAASLLPLAALVHAATAGFHARAFRVALKRTRIVFARPLYRWYCPTTEHEDTVQVGFVDGWDFSGVLDYQKGKQWVAVVEPVLGIVTAVLAAVATEFGSSSSSGLCKGLNAVQLAATATSLALLLITKPHAAIADRQLSLCGAVLQTAAALLGLLGIDAAAMIEVLQLVATALHTTGYAAFAAMGGSVRVLRLLRSKWRDRSYRRAQLLRQQYSKQRPLMPAEIASLARLAAAVGQGGAAGQAARTEALRKMLVAACRIGQQSS
jgi:hypothetical protein